MKSAVRRCLTVLLLGAAAATFAQAPPPPKAPENEPPPKWSTTAALGATVTAGNVDSVLVTGSVLTERKWATDLFTAGIDGGYGESDNVQNTEFLHGFAQYNKSLSERWYAYGRVDGLYDGIQEIDYRFIISPGMGYYLFKDERFTLSGEVGPGVVTEKTAAGENTYFTIRFAEKLTWKISDRSRLWQGIEYLPQVDDWGNYIINLEIGIEADITPKVALRLVLLDSYRSEPGFNSDGDELDENDFKLLAGVGYRF